MTPEIIDVDTTRLNRVMIDIHDALIGAGQEGDASNLVRDETRRLAAQIARFTPPKNRKQGEDAIERELRSLVSEANPALIDEIGSQHGLTHIDTFIAGEDGGRIELKWDRIDPTGERLPELHAASRNKRGKIPKGPKGTKGVWRARIMVPFGVLDPYIEKVQAKVGRWKASWSQVAMDLGAANVAAWIKRHLPTPKGISDISGLRNGEFPSVTFGSRAPNVSQQKHFITGAVRARVKAMEKRLKLIVSGYAKDVKNGGRVKRQVRQEGSVSIN